ncbi:CobW family GTP-binding protein [Clostridium ihumii]|uniref:CobW family GTP-binding protein n=1 Tax=Clostridium ihumii TaxID=1470356 RepID=UPI00058CD71A|nr:CobW family GTP-binding protein [Clostridium ihumii]
MTTKIDIISGFLGAGKTTLIKKLISETLYKENLVIIENEFGEIGIDGGILRKPGIEIKEMNSGCICCTLVGDFSTALKEVIHKYKPNRIIIEPSGVGKLSDVLNACNKVAKKEDVKMNMCISVVDANKYKMYMRNFSEFFANQIEFSQTVILSRTQNIEQDSLTKIVKDVQKINKKANIITTPWTSIKSETIISVAEKNAEIELEYQINKEIKKFESKEKEVDSNKTLKRFHINSRKEEKHSANDIFDVWGEETPKTFSNREIENILRELGKDKYGVVLRAKGIVQTTNKKWVQFDFVPEEIDIKSIEADYTGRLCVIGKKLNKTAIKELFKI